MSTTHQTETRTDHSIRVAVALGAEVTRDPADATEYTGRGFGVQDPEGTTWFFGTYAG